MSALAPGFYKATVRGVPDQIVMLTDSSFNDPWVSLTGGDNDRWHRHELVTDARPLIVLDLSDYAPHILASLIDAIDKAGHVTLANDLREQTKPARIPEPGLWGVVEADSDSGAFHYTWIHYPAGWAHNCLRLPRPWAQLVNPVLIRDGLS